MRLAAAGSIASVALKPMKNNHNPAAGIQIASAAKTLAAAINNARAGYAGHHREFAARQCNADIFEIVHGGAADGYVVIHRDNSRLL